ncbi:photosynthetic complex putative assembly protein PuhB [Stappia sp.]|uniref:photosynthetic complex putative assembly protein PuhB n=1 Tax=Stappia sp. TaxID=1870903 RepID=UPI0032D9142D
MSAEIHEAPEHEFEPVPGLPETLPEGEFILWQGRPEHRRIAQRILKNRWIAGYFLVIVVWALVAGYYDDRPLGYILFSAGALTVLAAIVLALVEGFAWAVAKTTLYTITNARVAMRIGAALSVTFNLPFSEIEAASVDRRADGSGNIALRLRPDIRLSWLVLWPHARAWRFSRPEPTLICLPNVTEVATLLAREMSPHMATAEARPQARSDAAPARPRGEMAGRKTASALG